MKTPPPEIRAHIHPDLFPIGSIEDGTDSEIAAAEAWLKQEGCTHARGPMGRTTWTAYRAVTATDGRAPFLGETIFSPTVWMDRGYQACAHYASALADNVEQANVVAERSRALVSAGWKIRGLDVHESFDHALQCFYRISSAAFVNAFSYTPISLDQFRSMYGPIEGMLDPRMVLTAFNPSNEPVGFCFTIPDRLNPQLQQFIIKTLAVDPSCHQSGVGSWLTGMAHSQAHELGWTQGGIHALMWTGSHSRTISKNAATIFRRYALFEKAL